MKHILLRSMTAWLLATQPVFLWAAEARNNEEQNLNGLKQLNSVYNLLQFTDALAPQFKLKEWIIFAQSKGLDLKKIKIEDVKISHQDFFIKGVTYPFQMNADLKSIVYQGVTFSFDFSQTPAANFELFKNKMGVFKELRDRKSQAFVELLLPAAMAEDYSIILMSSFIIAAALIGARAAFGLIGLAMVGGAFVAGTAQAYKVLMATFSAMKDNVQREYTDFMGIELQCSEPPELIDSKTKEKVTQALSGYRGARYTGSPSIRFDGRSESFKLEDIGTGLRYLCESPERVDQFNQTLFALKKKLINKELDPLSSDRALAAEKRAYQDEKKKTNSSQLAPPPAAGSK